MYQVYSCRQELTQQDVVTELYLNAFVYVGKIIEQQQVSLLLVSLLLFLSLLLLADVTNPSSTVVRVVSRNDQLREIRAMTPSVISVTYTAFDYCLDIDSYYDDYQHRVSRPASSLLSARYWTALLLPSTNRK